MRQHALAAVAILALTATALPANAFHNQFEFEWVQAAFPPACSHPGSWTVIRNLIFQPVACGLRVLCESDGQNDGLSARPVAAPGLGGLCYMDYDSDCSLDPDQQPAHGGCGFLAPCPFPVNAVTLVCQGVNLPQPTNTFSQYRMCDLPGNVNGGPVPSLGNVLNAQFNQGMLNNNFPCHHFQYVVGPHSGQTNQHGVCISDDYLWSLGLTTEVHGSVGSHVTGFLPHLVYDTKGTDTLMDDSWDDLNWPTAYGSYRTEPCTPGAWPFLQDDSGQGVVWVDPETKNDIFFEVTGEIITDPVPPDLAPFLP